MAAWVKDRLGERLRPWVWGGAACLLLAPALAMWRGTDGVHWTAGDFLAMGLLLAAAGGLYELGLRLDRRLAYRAAFWLAALTGVLTVWMNLAVGMLGDPGHPANAMFIGVLGIALVGAAGARGRAGGMAKVMLAAGVAQLLAALAGVLLGFRALEIALTGAFALPWLLAAVLFQTAGRVDVADP